MYETSDAKAFRDVAVYADQNCVKANRVDARFVDHKGKKDELSAGGEAWKER